MSPKRAIPVGDVAVMSRSQGYSSCTDSLMHQATLSDFFKCALGFNEGSFEGDYYMGFAVPGFSVYGFGILPHSLFSLSLSLSRSLPFPLSLSLARSLAGSLTLTLMLTVTLTHPVAESHPRGHKLRSCSR